jgi:hypothetical protein
MILSHGNALICQRKFLLLTVKARPSSRQKFFAYEFKGRFACSEFFTVPATIAVDWSIVSRTWAITVANLSVKRPSLLIDQCARLVMVVLLSPQALTPKASPRLYMCPPLCRRHDA